jgi:hypothetical protein
MSGQGAGPQNGPAPFLGASCMCGWLVWLLKWWSGVAPKPAPKPYKHPAFPQPDSPDTVLWRYLDVWKFEWLLTEKRLFMARADQLGDPLEGTSPEGHRRWWREQLTKATTDTERAIIQRNEQFLTSFRNAHYVSCWHANPEEAKRMWDEYTASPNAVAIYTTLASLRASLPHYVELGLVRYIDYAAADLPTMNIFERVTHKNLDFAFEQELRAVATRPTAPDDAAFDQAHFASQADASVTVFAPSIDPIRLISGVILHPEATDDFRANIAALCTAHGLPPPQHSTLRSSP